MLAMAIKAGIIVHFDIIGRNNYLNDISRTADGKMKQHMQQAKEKVTMENKEHLKIKLTQLVFCTYFQLKSAPGLLNYEGRPVCLFGRSKNIFFRDCLHPL